MQWSDAPLRDAAQAKIAFPLQRDEEGYPPADWEHLWARTVDGDRYVIDNTPFFVRGISFGDVVAVDLRSGELVFREILTPSRHSTLRVILFDAGMVSDLRAQLRNVGCATELSHVPGLLAVDVPPEVSLQAVRRLLDDGEHAGRWEYEESTVRQ